MFSGAYKRGCKVFTLQDNSHEAIIPKDIFLLVQKELVKKANQKADYDAIADEILRLRDMRKQAEVDSVVKDEQMRLIQDLQDFINSLDRAEVVNWAKYLGERKRIMERVLKGD